MSNSQPAFEPIFGSSNAAPDTQPQESSANWVDALAGQAGFSADARFGLSPADAAAMAMEAKLAARDAEMAQILAEAEQRGREAALAEMTEEGRIAGSLSLELTKLDEVMKDQLATRIAETVCALCEATLAPMVLDRDALQKRCIDAAAMVGEGFVDATLRLHPDDISLLDTDFAATWHILPDPDLERGSVQFDTGEGAVRDGPAQWRAALREALGL